MRHNIQYAKNTDDRLTKLIIKTTQLTLTGFFMVK